MEIEALKEPEGKPKAQRAPRFAKYEILAAISKKSTGERYGVGEIVELDPAKWPVQHWLDKRVLREIVEE